MRTHPLLLCFVVPLLSDLRAQGDAPVSPPSIAPIAEHHATGVFDRVRFDQPRSDGPLWALGRSWKASFDSHGFTVIPFFGSEAPRNYPLHLSLAGATVGGEPLPLQAGAPRRDATTVLTTHGALTEVVETAVDHLEQSFVFDSLPNRGAIVVDVRIDSELAASYIAGGLRFANALGHVDYTKAIAVDASGQRLPLQIEWTGSSARMEIPASFVEQAQLPLVLDPTLNYWYLLGSGTTQLQHDSDVASIQVLGGRKLMVWQRQWSVTDQDCFGLLFDGNLGLIATDFAIDFTSQDWRHISIAGSNYAQNFLLAAEIRSGALSYIGGRTIAADATLGALFDIERDGVVGLAGNNHHPAVGADPYFGAGRYTVAFQKQNAGGAEIYVKQVSTAGALVTTLPVQLSVAPSQASRPSISKSCGQSNGQPAHWLVTWQQPYPSAPNDAEVHGRFVYWSGSVNGAAFGIGLTVGEETAPASCSPIDASGVRYWPICYEWASSPGQPREIRCHLLRLDGSLQTNFTVSNGAPGTDCREPSADSDGTRFVVGMSKGLASAPQAVEAVTVAYLPAPNAFRVDERSTLSTLSQDSYGQTSICAEYSGGSTFTSRYAVSFTEQTLNTFRLAVFAGHSGSTAFFATRPTQCGSLPIAASGSPTIGGTVTIDVASSGFAGTLFGFPGNIPINAGCSCLIGVDQGITFVGNQLVWNVPLNAAYVGLPLAVQGWTFAGSQCLGAIDISDTVDFTIR